ncbi:type I-E CRISPR-associated protein Cas7/Cse4/CasC [Cupriavidus sp. AcVe19-1a]|uniref:type I-E CRISPR-associated protein Cas7/Cse4/CasC n=1 Tax=Cupriavidus sp. AcVe19-1a TaxID=2821359 RepID=UPI001AE6CBE7|nr:type I-E CRISPR-associated protein Cas7/Cse4/CasC [Cupriavidus sp. AcVe19-1a]MBP0633506.1 type I-E CRISPR-associated protein Cas7/Cse4/CasC [Cupriavidus sp. AcVe19-1a]
MSQPRFIQIHTLHSYPAALLNRDDAGLAKRLPLGDAVRTRISSQCLKRHWRMADDQFSLANLGVPMAVRSRHTLDHIREQLLARGASNSLALAAAEALRNGGLLDKAGKEQQGQQALETGQAILLGKAEIDYIVMRVLDLIGEHAGEKPLKAAVAAFLKEEKKNIETLKHGSGLESALFGRMVTSDVLANRDAAVYVGHAFTVHEAQMENDYFTVVDDLLSEAGQSGAAGIFDTELASGLYYGYVVVDVPQLVANLEGIDIRECFSAASERRDLAGQVVQHLLHLISTVSPGAKRGSTAPFNWAKFVLVETGDWQPRSLAGAFQNALPLNSPHLLQAAMQRLSAEVAKLDAAYGAPLQRRYLAVDEVEVPQGDRLPLADLAKWARERIVQGM